MVREKSVPVSMARSAMPGCNGAGGSMLTLGTRCDILGGCLSPETLEQKICSTVLNSRHRLETEHSLSPGFDSVRGNQPRRSKMAKDHSDGSHMKRRGGMPLLVA